MTRHIAAILLDAENILCQMNDDLFKDYSLPDRVRVLATALDTIALENGARAEGRFTALALRPGADEPASTAAKILLECRYSEVAWVQPRPNAADLWLLEKTKAVISSNRFDFFLLATGDTGEPFPTIIKLLTENGKRVHIVPYSRLSSMNGHPLISSSILRPYLGRILIQKPFVSPLLAEETFGHRLKADVLHFRDNPSDPSILPHHRVWIERIITKAVGICSEPFHDPHVNFLYLEERVREIRWRDVQRPSREEIRIILQALVRFTDLFEEISCLRFNHRSQVAAIA